MLFLSDNEIDLESFKLLDETSLKELIPKVGLRVKFAYRLKSYVSIMTTVSAYFTLLLIVTIMLLVCFKRLATLQEASVEALLGHLKYIHGIHSGTGTKLV